MFRGFKLLSLLGLVFTCNACSGVSYMSNSSLAELEGTNFRQDSNLFDTSNGAKQYGALVFKKDSSKGIREEGNAFAVALKRQKNEFFGEATLFQTKNENKTYIDRAMFDLGVDRRNRGINLGMTLRF
ncbi:MAG: hypothetical protein SFT90_03945 [Rickettsiales bacterium]|nr:hypothetical protein [Rickettsiales bacterium]